MSLAQFIITLRNEIHSRQKHFYIPVDYTILNAHGNDTHYVML